MPMPIDLKKILSFSDFILVLIFPDARSGNSLISPLSRQPDERASINSPVFLEVYSSESTATILDLQMVFVSISLMSGV